mmetsp:Transcript_24943/g.56289  ORF Transcript_24943/g.56289 Transcript_24943/m.56289 type:complete len:251 (+) Transcript_24943:18-770(+)
MRSDCKLARPGSKLPFYPLLFQRQRRHERRSRLCQGLLAQSCSIFFRAVVQLRFPIHARRGYSHLLPPQLHPPCRRTVPSSTRGQRSSVRRVIQGLLVPTIVLQHQRPTRAVHAGIVLPVPLHFLLQRLPAVVVGRERCRARWLSGFPNSSRIDSPLLIVATRIQLTCMHFGLFEALVLGAHAILIFCSIPLILVLLVSQDSLWVCWRERHLDRGELPISLLGHQPSSLALLLSRTTLAHSFDQLINRMS